MNSSVYNPTEAEGVVELIRKLHDRNITSVGVITFYSSQVQHLERRLKEERLECEVNTVDGYQGREKDIIILSCVRSRCKNLGFLEDKRRLNVAITRAKFCLFLVGDFKLLRKNE